MVVTVATPRLIRIGPGAIGDVASLLGSLVITRPFIVTDPHMLASGLIERLLAPLRAAGLQPAVFSETVPDPSDTVVLAGLAALRATDADGLIAFGGGSPMDTAKAINILAAAPPGTAIASFRAPATADRAALPLICIPTTAGTGSEVTRFTVITDTARGEKMLIAGLGALPAAALVDHELTFSLPARITADTGIDSLTHALEAFVSRRANAVSDAFAGAAMRLIAPNLRGAYHHPQDAAAREAMMAGATLAGLAFSNASVALVHGMSRPIGAHFHVPHGLSNAMLLPAVTAFGLAAALPRYAQAARAMGLDGPDDAAAAQALLAELRALNRDLAVPSPRDWGIGPADWARLLPVMADQALASGSPANNPRVPDAAQIIALYREVFD